MSFLWIRFEMALRPRLSVSIWHGTIGSNYWKEEAALKDNNNYRSGGGG
jgi:hypothetical protein